MMHKCQSSIMKKTPHINLQLAKERRILLLFLKAFEVVKDEAAAMIKG